MSGGQTGIEDGAEVWDEWVDEVNRRGEDEAVNEKNARLNWNVSTCDEAPIALETRAMLSCSIRYAIIHMVG
jgi:hypothetical protein